MADVLPGNRHALPVEDDLPDDIAIPYCAHPERALDLTPNRWGHVLCIAPAGHDDDHQLAGPVFHNLPDLQEPTAP